MIHTVVGIIVGALAGTHIATWGMYKDAPHEGFTWRRYTRAIWLCLALGALGSWLLPLPLDRVGGLLVFFGVVYGAERALEELYKTFLREEDQSKYTIPMQFHIFGRVVESRAARWGTAAGAVAVVLALIAVTRHVQLRFGDPPLLAVALFGSVSGWISAVGGAWKDAPIEGFETFKFFRSPVIALTYALLLSPFTSDLVLIALGAIGFTVASIETYKTFYHSEKPRGKFAGKPILFPEILQFRKRFVPVYAAVWAVILGTFLAAYALEVFA